MGNDPILKVRSLNPLIAGSNNSNKASSPFCGRFFQSFFSYYLGVSASYQNQRTTDNYRFVSVRQWPIRRSCHHPLTNGIDRGALVGNNEQALN